VGGWGGGGVVWGGVVDKSGFHIHNSF